MRMISEALEPPRNEPTPPPPPKKVRTVHCVTTLCVVCCACCVLCVLCVFHYCVVSVCVCVCHRRVLWMLRAFTTTADVCLDKGEDEWVTQTAKPRKPPKKVKSARLTGPLPLLLVARTSTTDYILDGHHVRRRASRLLSV